jgi:spore coat protein U-like protein
MTRSRYLLISLIASAAMAPLSTGGLADGFTVNARALGACSVPSPQITWTAVNATFAGVAINITQFGGPNNDRAIASAISLEDPDTLCNYSIRVSIRSKNGGLVQSRAMAVASKTGAFPWIVPYTLQATWGSVNLLLDTNGPNGHPVVAQGLSSGPLFGNLTLNFATPANSLPVPSGYYHDTVVIEAGIPM